MEDGGAPAIIALLIAGRHIAMAEAIMDLKATTIRITITIIQTGIIQEIYTATEVG